jgi:uncharacterized protein (DUF2062 family)
MRRALKRRMKRYWLKFLFLFKRVLLENDSSEKLARGFAVGVFWGVLPTFGFAALFAIPVAVLFKANKLTTIIGTLVSNPFTYPFFLLWGTRIGTFILRTAPLTWSWNLLKLQTLVSVSKALLLGTVVLAMCMALASYLVLLVLIPLTRRIAHHRLKTG